VDDEPVIMPRPFDLLPPLLSGLAVTIEVTLGASLLAAALAFLAGLARLSRHRILRGVARTYIEVFRGTSALVQLYWVFFALPIFGIQLGAMTAGIVVLGLNIGAYGAEIVRGAVNAVPRGQHEAAIALNMTERQKLRRIIVPQATVAMIPPFGNLLIELLKSTSLVSLITIADLTFQGQTLRAESLRTWEIFSWILVLYFVVAGGITLGMRRVERKLSFGLDRGGMRG
jgi:polar amino acid transport system permease protein